MNRVVDYEAVGFRCGLEVHQQLLTDHKMFCRCPAGRYTRDHDGTILRHMRPTLSELGEYDGTALMEFKTRKNIVYLLNAENVCTYEMDDTPPFLVNEHALDIAIEQALMLGCDIVDEIHIARKQYLDGSIPTGFQRTAIVGVNGSLPFRGRDIRIIQMSVEEDSCREVSDQGHLIVWRTDRLGMPLVEAVTAPDFRTPEEVAEGILLIGRVYRSTLHVRTGMGASRQDVNVSVRGGRRVEIKGVPKAGWAPRLVHGEAVRQLNLLAIREEMEKRGFRCAEDVVAEDADVTDLFAESDWPALRADGWARFVEESGRRAGMELGGGPFTVRALRLPGLAGLDAHETQPDRVFADELGGRVRVIAGLDHPAPALTDGTWVERGGVPGELEKLRARMGCADRDAVVLVRGPESDTETAVAEIAARWAEATGGVPHETRQPFESGHTDFERILPGADRMYPDTDSPPTRVTRERMRAVADTLPPPPWEREARYAALGVPESTVRYLLRRGGAARVDAAVAACGGNAGSRSARVSAGVDAGDPARAAARRACFLFGERWKGWARAGVDVESIGETRWTALFAETERRPLAREAVGALVRVLAGDAESTVADAAGALGIGEEPDGWREAVTTAVAERREERRGLDAAARARHHTGRVLRELRGKVPVAEVAGAVGRALERGAPEAGRARTGGGAAA
ncbi:MAG: Glu-tRNA(Gln) amidotransferase subunit GatE [Gemmatimonadota bacterium]|nr:Glu-tRNA(Gln) amidotransferase subunit GatE [Gemmatimonadota bacterium]